MTQNFEHYQTLHVLRGGKVWRFPVFEKLVGRGCIIGLVY
jgi:hypothetical protein